MAVLVETQWVLMVLVEVMKILMTQEEAKEIQMVLEEIQATLKEGAKVGPQLCPKLVS